MTATSPNTAETTRKLSRRDHQPSLVWAPEPDDAPEPDNVAVPPRAAYAAGLRQHHLANTAYPIAHRQTIWRYRQDRARHRALLGAAIAAADGIGLYVHYPFCERRCAFCEYTVVAEHDEAIEERYCAALLAELEAYRPLVGAAPLLGLDLGGGTPALVAPERIGRLLEAIRDRFTLAPSFSISIETTPRIAARQPERIAALRRLGIERISMGLQVVSRRLLRRYGRDINSVSDNARAAAQIRAAGFDRYNIDLMYGFADQSPESWDRTLRHAIDLQPDYVTLYRMRYKGTRVSDEAARVSLDRVVALYELARERLLAAGYRANPGKNGFTRRDDDPPTSAYLTQRVSAGAPYLGLGLGAQTFTNNILAYNLGAASKRLDGYLAAIDRGELPLQDLYLLPPSEAMAKMLSVSFYFGEIDLAAFRRRFGVPLEARFAAEIDFVERHGLMRRDGRRLRLTPEGARRINGVIALFYSPRVKRHLLGLEGD